MERSETVIRIIGETAEAVASLAERLADDWHGASGDVALHAFASSIRNTYHAARAGEDMRKQADVKRGGGDA